MIYIAEEETIAFIEVEAHQIGLNQYYLVLILDVGILMQCNTVSRHSVSQWKLQALLQTRHRRVNTTKPWLDCMPDYQLVKWTCCMKQTLTSCYDVQRLQGLTAKALKILAEVENRDSRKTAYWWTSQDLFFPVLKKRYTALRKEENKHTQRVSQAIR